MKTAVIHARIEPSTKRKAEGILHKVGITPTEAIRIFYRQITLRGGIPFAIEVPNHVTTTTLEKSRRCEGITDFDSVDEMFESWEK